jgi:hypothetical protein
MIKNSNIQRGIITKLFTNKGFGFLQNQNGEELFFQTKSFVKDFCFVGDTVTYIQIPSKRYFKQYDAVNVTKAYLSADGYYVVNRPENHIHTGLESELSNLIAMISCNRESFIVKQLDFAYPVGKSNCIIIKDDDEIIYAIRKGRKGHTKFVKGRNPEPTNSITIVLKKTDSFYTIITAFHGAKAEVEPWDLNATQASLKFWNHHALINGSEPFEYSSVTNTCPWDCNSVNNHPNNMPTNSNLR